MKTTKDIDNWIQAIVVREYMQIPVFVIHSARRTNTIDLIYNHISTQTGVNTDTIKEILSDQPLSTTRRKDNEIHDIFSGEYEVELTDDLIKKLIKEQDMDADFLSQAREMGGKWNTKRKSIIFPDFT